MIKVFTNVCAEILHIGHLNYLERAKKLGDYLIVGVNSDEMFYHYKKRWPIIPFEERKRIISALRIVDEVREHTFPSQLDIFDGVDIVAMGPEWHQGKYKHQKKAKEYLLKKGIKLIELPRTPGISTTAILERAYREVEHWHQRS